MPVVYPTQNEIQSFGSLTVNITSMIRSQPIEGAQISISYNGEPGNVIETAVSNEIGQIEAVELPTPPIEYSMEPSANQPYAEYTITVQAPGFEEVEISGAQVLPAVEAIQNVTLIPKEENTETDGETTAESFVVPPHTLFGNYPPKIAENEVKSIEETGEIVLSRVVIPEFVVVHDGPPQDTSATNYYVRYRDYIKNVASCEIYATWPIAAIYANIFAIQSFTLNRVYTEWYRNRGYNFTITSSTAYDHKWVAGRNIFDTISQAVDEIFANYLSRPGVIQPILTQYCDGRRTTCPGWMTQWGSKYLGDEGYSPLDILRYFYGEDIYVNTAEEISGVPSSWPGYNLNIGSSGDKVRQMQNQLNVISQGYPLIPRLSADGIYGSQTAEAVRVFQRIFGISQTGIVDFATWYRISEIYVAVSRIAELN